MSSNMDSLMMEIKKNSNALHDVAENTGILKKLKEGTVSVESYSEYLFNLYEIYKTLEFNLQKHDKNRIVKEFTTMEVYRSEAIYKDLRVLFGSRLSSMKLLASTKAYIQRLNELSEREPELLVAHAYTRFLADLFGGRTIYNVLKESCGMKDEALNYYKYEALDDAEGMKSFIMDYHEKLNLLDIKKNFEEKLINEVSNAYVYNIAISNELEVSKFNK
ncbi:heme oxygenase (biliverdin-producing) [Clostridium sardiniense]|uniref:biliverdin-producing heme oxygenase n=1 Tax=Clostridium sardiniense TaxID=29369 RepID=UPI003D34CA6E